MNFNSSKGLLSMMLELNISAKLKMVNETAKEYFIFKTEVFMKVPGSKIKCMEKDHFITPMDILLMMVAGIRIVFTEKEESIMTIHENYKRNLIMLI